MEDGQGGSGRDAIVMGDDNPVSQSRTRIPDFFLERRAKSKAAGAFGKKKRVCRGTWRII